MSKIGQLTKSLITNKPCVIGSEIYNHYNKTIPFFEGEAVYIYSFKEKKMLFARGWEALLGYKDDEITMLDIISITTEKYYNFSNELNDKAMLFLLNKKQDLEKYSFTLELEKYHKNGNSVALFSKVGVHCAPNNVLEEIIGVSRKSLHFKQSDIMQFAAYGPEKVAFEETLSKELFNHLVISRKEKEALQLAAEGFAFKEIAHKLNVSQSAIEKRILPLYKRFSVKSLPHLISFAHKNYII